MEQEVLSVRCKQLIRIIQTSLADSEPHSQAFVRRLLGAKYTAEIGTQLNEDFLSNEATYGGYPQVAFLGFNLRIDNTLSPEHISRFLIGLDRLRNRSEKGLESLIGDDVALLGIAEGLTQIQVESYRDKVEAAKQWLLQMIDKKSTVTLWSGRLRDLAGDLLDGRGRLRALPVCPEVSARAIDITLRIVWPELFTQTLPPSKEVRKELLAELLIAAPPDGDPEQAAVWLKTINILVEQAVEALLPGQNTDALAALATIKIKLDQKAEQQAKIDLWLYFGFLVIVGLILAILTFYLTWNVMEPWIYFIGGSITLGSYAYYAITRKELLSPRDIYEQQVLAYKKKFYKELGFDLNKMNSD